jgi:hypothetical protein
MATMIGLNGLGIVVSLRSDVTSLPVWLLSNQASWGPGELARNSDVACVGLADGTSVQKRLAAQPKLGRRRGTGGWNCDRGSRILSGFRLARRTPVRPGWPVCLRSLRLGVPGNALRLYWKLGAFDVGRRRRALGSLSPCHSDLT